MRIEPLGSTDACILQPVLHEDERGSFMRTWCASSFKAAGLDFVPMQGNVSVTRVRGSVRGMHFQREPRADAKIVRCSSGRIHDTIVDLREGSPMLGQPVSIELSNDEAKLLFIPAGFAHGFQALSDDVRVEYLMGVEFDPALADGFRYDDPSIRIAWPEPVTVISAADRSWPDLAPRFRHLREGLLVGHA